MTKVYLPNNLKEGDIWYNVTLVTPRVSAPDHAYAVKCNACGHVANIYNYQFYNTRICSKCKAKFYNKPDKDFSHLVGQTRGEFIITKVDKTHITYVCANGTEGTSPRGVKLESRECRCIKCKPSTGFIRKKYGTQWKRISQEVGVFWKDYVHFESWLDSNLPRPTELHKVFKKIDDSEKWTPDNVWWATNHSSFHISKWLKILANQKDVKFIKETTDKLHFVCNNGHGFSRLKGRVSNRNKRTGYKIICVECLNESAKKKRNSITSNIPTLESQITHKHPSIKLVSDPQSRYELSTFECTCCNTSFKMTIRELYRKSICPVCKSEQWASFCDDRIRDKFDGKIIRTGVWTLAELETTWKCRKHNTHFTKTYDKIISSVSGGCPDCINFTVPDPKAATRMYYVRFQYDNTFFYKIGITQNTVENRFDREISKRKFKIIKEWLYPTWKEAYDEEQSIIRIFKSELLCRGEKPLRNTGNTEIFYWDVMELDHEKNY